MSTERSTDMTSAEARPFGLDLSQAVCDRATRLAKAMFGAFDAQVVLIQDGVVWRSHDPQSRIRQTDDPAATAVLDAGELLWVEDGLLDARFRDQPLVAKPPHLRFYAGAPIRLADGSTPGVLCVGGLEVRPFEPHLAARLQDLADFIADEWARAQAAKARETSDRERDAMFATLSACIQGVPAELVLTDRDLRILGFSPRWAQQLGLHGKALVGMDLFEVADGFYERWRPDIERCLTGEVIKAEQVFAPRFEGETRWVTAEVAPWRDANGQVAGLFMASHDITEVVQALEATARSERRLTIAMEMADLHVYEMDYVKRELIKVGAEDTFFDAPKTFDDLFHDVWGAVDPRDRQGAIEAWERHLEKGGPYHAEYRTHRHDGREVWAASAGELTLDRNGRPLRLVGALQNITGRKAAEAALRQAKDDAEAANRAKSTFLATMSHEIRTPLNGVLGMAQAMAADELSELQRGRLDVIRQSGETLLAILNDVLDLSKIEAGKLELEEAEFDVSELARGAHAAFTAIANKKGLSFDLKVERPAQGIYRGDSTRVRQILYNLVSNALKFTETGEVRVLVGRMGDELRLEVSDTGIGISQDRLAALFQKFEQADASTTRRYGGTGLGLAICRELVQLMGGRIVADSRAGEGATFVVTLPLPKVSSERVEPTTSVEAAPAPVLADDLPPPRVLAAEDNTVNQLVLKTLLHQIGIDPVIVDTGRAAVEAWRRETWDVILMDVQMPEMDGPTATAAIRAAEAAENRPRTPIIALTANAMAHQVAEYAQSGMDGFVAKPIEVGRLFDALQQALEPAAASRAA